MIHGVTNDNIGLFDLNVSQYYDVRSYPSDPNFSPAGSRDQGFQKRFYSRNKSRTTCTGIIRRLDISSLQKTGQGLFIPWLLPVILPPDQVAVSHLMKSTQMKKGMDSTLTASPVMAENSVYMGSGNINWVKVHPIKLTYKPQNNDIEAIQFPFNLKPQEENYAIAFSPLTPKKCQPLPTEILYFFKWR
ncbi:MAG: hypothetical protein IPL63_14490 [Saprospiraceae bacterium]|nr:hypothetical protein [Saprospiraceae bacterium]